MPITGCLSDTMLCDITPDFLPVAPSTPYSNLLSPYIGLEGCWDTNGKLVVSDTIRHTDYIPVRNGTTYCLSVTTPEVQIVLFDSNYIPLQIIQNSDPFCSTLEQYITIDNPDCTYLSLNYKAIDEAYIYAYETSDETSVPTRRYSIGFLGDSITLGGLSTTDPSSITGFTYHSILSTKLDINTYYTAIGGLRLCGPDSLVNYIPRMNPTLDCIVIMIGINDFHGAAEPLGNTTDHTLETFYGSLHILFEEIIEKYPGRPIYILTPITSNMAVTQVTNNNGNTLADYSNAIQETAANYDNVSVIDTYSWSTSTLSTSDISLFGDGLHPTQACHYKIADFLYQELIQNANSE